ncbi:MAG: hypothetical protein OXF09_04835 [Hyphomicrobiales bacterium]|nr:hypothetical protein [Hyphomicrobiales bacterium]
MKTLTTIFAIAFMALAFSVPSNSALAKAANDDDCDQYTGAVKATCKSKRFFFGELEDPDQSESERDVADSDEESSTSAAGATEQ